MPTKNKLFVIHFHRATHDHYDFRLELGGVLKSWALPKVPQKIKGIKRLAIQVEDHAMSYANFEGEITEGYGKGTVKIWDKGTYSLDKKNPKEIIFELKGKKLKGKYILLKTSLGKQPGKNWLFFKL